MNVRVPQLLRADRNGDLDRAARVPELWGLSTKSVVVLGLGCIGAPSALEFARAGVGKLWLVDPDLVDPATTVRWPLGQSAAGIPKVHSLARFIETEYPAVAVKPVAAKVGGIRQPDTPRDVAWLQDVLREASLVYDATAELGVRKYASDLALSARLQYVACSATAGGWGGEVVRLTHRPGAGCWTCLLLMCEDGEVPPPPADPLGDLQAAGCGDLSFTGASFDLAEVWACGVRAAVATIAESYPPLDWDGTVISLRDSDGRPISPRHHTFKVRPHRNCPRCSGA